MSLVVDILERFLGNAKGHNSSSGQMQFDCPRCAEDDKGHGKGNLEINYDKGWYHCWTCGESHNMKGHLNFMIRKYGGAKALKDFLIVKPEFIKKSNDGETHDLKLPQNFKYLHNCNPKSYRYNEAINYLKKRGITPDIIEKHKLGFCASGKYAGRIIIPSYNINGELNFFVGRAWDKWNKPKILNEEAEKELIIFNEGLINWDATIYLVEGPFDHLITPNSIPLLGKYVSPYLFYMLQMNANSNIVIILDGDAYVDSKKIYQMLNVMNLRNKVKIVQLGYDLDPSLINQKYGRKRYIKVLSKSKIIPESRL